MSKSMHAYEFILTGMSSVLHLLQHSILVEYLPISSLEKSKQIMEEFSDIWKDAISKRSLPGHFIHIEPNFSDYGLADHYTSQHTAVQYTHVTSQLIASVQAVQTGRN
ncbi:mediator of RNA polymerase II transcription subunit 20a isoform X2 [Gossypium arboreum]|uniref:Mediator of RNA polymerase II transcription subunit 20 n=1 Tax=Gossypium hirsutum TaxID=3635 RepID=A0A1U8I6I9_GOSHI|nr:mediator of RNA polymerase II transcription subunit 20a isoform X2 [Gossypium hirsutum]XP_052879662.1 mediator of RNA polymerase II transcription subunit 20a isoform X2 [Gossypium arboreum]